MRTPSIAFFGLALLLAPAASAQAPSVIDCKGPFGPDSSHERLVQAFGRANVTTEEVYAAEGETAKATVLFAKDPARRLEVFWGDEKARKKPSFRVEEAGSQWQTPQGIRIGSTLAEVEALNGKPFELSGFGWDYGGSVTSWKGGKLDAGQPGGCRVSITFNPDENAPEKAQSKVQGDKAFLSSNPNMKASKPTVGRIFIGFAQ